MTLITVHIIVKFVRYLVSEERRKMVVDVNASGCAILYRWMRHDRRWNRVGDCQSKLSYIWKSIDDRRGLVIIPCVQWSGGSELSAGQVNICVMGKAIFICIYKSRIISYIYVRDVVSVYSKGKWAWYCMYAEIVLAVLTTEEIINYEL